MEAERRRTHLAKNGIRALADIHRADIEDDRAVTL